MIGFPYRVDANLSRSRNSSIQFPFNPSLFEKAYAKIFILASCKFFEEEINRTRLYFAFPTMLFPPEGFFISQNYSKDTGTQYKTDAFRFHLSEKQFRSCYLIGYIAYLFRYDPMKIEIYCIPYSLFSASLTTLQFQRLR